MEIETWSSDVIGVAWEGNHFCTDCMPRSFVSPRFAHLVDSTGNSLGEIRPDTTNLQPGETLTCLACDAVIDSEPPISTLVWESASTDDARDQNADSMLYDHSYWSLGPDGGGWSLELIVRDAALDEIHELGEHLGGFDTEEAAKAAAESRENS